MKEKISQWIEKFREWIGQNEDLTRSFTRAGNAAAANPQRLERWMIGAAVVACMWFLSDLASLVVEKWIPVQEVAPVSRVAPYSHHMEVTEFDVIKDRNLFNSLGKIPGQGGTEIVSDVPTKTTLPYQLVGTMIFKNNDLSVATLNDTSLDRSYPVQVGDEIPNKIKVKEVQKKKVIFVNLQSQKLEYVDLPEDPDDRPAFGTKESGIVRKSPDHLIVPRNEIDSSLSDINKLITQIRAFPDPTVPGAFKLTQIMPGSIFEKIGLKNNDTLISINGEAIDPLSAMSKLSELKTTNQLEISIKRDGQDKTILYDIQ